MSGTDRLAERFEEQSGRLRAIAYRMLGSRAEAEDVVQDAWLRLSAVRAGEIDNLTAWLTTVVAHECLRVLRARRHRREEPLPEAEPLPGRSDASGPEEEALTVDAVGRALLVVLERLGPAERLAFVLHDVFAVPFEEIAPIVGRTPVATRQLASRARRRVHGADVGEDGDPARQRRAVDAFLAAVRDGDFDALLAVLDPDVVLHDDSPGAAVMRGARAVAAHAAGFRWGAPFARPALVGGRPGLALARDGRVVGGLGFVVGGDRIVRIEVTSDPTAINVWSPEKRPQYSPSGTGIRPGAGSAPASSCPTSSWAT